MSKYTKKQIIDSAKTIKKNVEKNQKLGKTSKWSYYFAKYILSPKNDVNKISFEVAPVPSGTHISRTISKSDYLSLCKTFVKFVEKNKRLPNYLTFKDYKIRTRVYTYMLAKLVVFHSEKGYNANYVNVNSKAFTKPVETKNEVYNYFVKVFGSFDNTVDGFLTKIEGKGYDYYYDDRYSNKECIDRLKKGKGINCTDSCQMAMNIIQQLIDLKKYKKVECLHVDCSSGGHVKLRITKLDGSTFIRDIACVISDNGKSLSCVWCTNTPKAINPKWFMDNLNR